jgi:adenine-specific DNA methylase
MKTLIKFLVVAMVIVIANSVNAQNITDGLKTKSGVYMSFADYAAKKLNLEVDYTLEKHKIRINDFINKTEITVIHKEKKYTFKKNEIYGIRDGKGNDYRFSENAEYKIVQTDTLYIYTKEETVQSGNSKNYQRSQVTKYYFSKTGSSDIMELTKENLKKAFPEDHKLHDALDMMFKSDNDLSEYDNFHKSYKVVRLLKNSH